MVKAYKIETPAQLLALKDLVKVGTITPAARVWNTAIRGGKEDHISSFRDMVYVFFEKDKTTRKACVLWLRKHGAAKKLATLNFAGTERAYKEKAELEVTGDMLKKLQDEEKRSFHTT